MTPTDFNPSGIDAFCDLGSVSAHLEFTAPNKSCIWNDYPVIIKCRSFAGDCAPSNPATAYQINGYVAGPGVGPFTPPETDFPALRVYNYTDTILCGFKLQVRFTGFVTFGSTQQGVANPLTGCGACSDGTYYNGAFDSGWMDANTGDCFQAATIADQALALQVVLRPFSPVIGAGLINGRLSGQWIPDTSVITPEFEPYQHFGVFFMAPNSGGYKTLFLGDGDGASPPSSDWENSIIPGDAGMIDAMDVPLPGVIVDAPPSHGSMWWSSASRPEGQAILAMSIPEPTSPDALYLYLRLVHPGTSSVTGYMMAGTGTTADIYRIDSGSLTLLVSLPLQYPINEDFLMYRFWANGSLLGVQANMDTPDPAGPLPFVGGVVDSTYIQDGFQGVGLDATGEIVEVTSGGVLAQDIVVPRLLIRLATDACGNITTTWDAIKSAIDVMNVAGTCPVTCNVFGTGSDDAFPTQCIMHDADCTGGVYYREGMETP